MNQSINSEALLRQLAAIVAGMPAQQLNLRVSLLEDEYCGTICCALGAAGLHPGLSRKLNLRTLPNNRGWSVGRDRFFSFNYDEAGSRAFGISKEESAFLFAPPHNLDGKAHKTVFAQRITSLFQKRGWPVSKQYIENEAKL